MCYLLSKSDFPFTVKPFKRVVCNNCFSHSPSICSWIHLNKFTYYLFAIFFSHQNKNFIKGVTFFFFLNLIILSLQGLSHAYKLLDIYHFFFGWVDESIAFLHSNCWIMLSNFILHNFCEVYFHYTPTGIAYYF